MHKHAFQTTAGEIWLWAETEMLPAGRPVVLFINGAFSIARPRSYELPGLLPGAVVLNAHLPGNHCPRLNAHTVEVYAGAYTEVLDQIGRPGVVIGASIGALLSLGITSPWVKGLVLLEPPLQTGKLWCVIENFRAKLAAAPCDDDLREFLWNVFGVSETTLENRDYRPLLDGLARPGWAAFGELPLMPPRPFKALPSLVDEPERLLLAAHPLLRTEVVPTVGHNVPGRAISYVRRWTQDLLDRFVGAPLDPSGLLPG